MQQFLGHSSIEITMDVYTEVSANVQREEMMKMQDIFEDTYSRKDDEDEFWDGA